MNDFNDLEKQSAFDRIASCYFEQNFGSMGKADFDLLMFHIFIKHLETTNASTDDYSISKALGITQQRVRNYKIKDRLRFGEPSSDWSIELMKEALHHPHYSTDDQYITLSFDDPNILIEVQHFIESRGSYVDYSFNPKLLKMKTIDFAQLIIEIGEEKNEEEVWKQLRTVYRKETGGNDEITKEKLGTQLRKGGLDFVKTIISDVITGLITSKLTG